jgi:phosphatidylglycerol:prolipoprotein diacylglycerol transferase
MFPILAKLGPLTIHTYGALAALGFVAAVLWSVREAERLNLEKKTRFLISVSGLPWRPWRVPASGFVATNLDYYRSHPVDVFKFWQGGLVFYGGLILALVSGLDLCS